MKIGRIARRTAGAAALAVLAFFALVPTGHYLVRAGWAEARILWRARPIAELVRDPSTAAATRSKLQLVLAARAFAADSVKLRAKQSFTTYSRIDRDTLIVVLTAAYQDRLAYKTWWFPIVGSVPYKGYFDVREAKQAAAELSRDGFDAYLRPASAFSTLGYLNDPVLSTTLDEDSVSLVNTVIHELTHNTFYASGQAVFNESFANFAGAHGAEWFYAARADGAAVALAQQDWDRQRTLGRFWSAVYNSVDSAFKAHPASKAERLAAREIVFAGARARFEREIEPTLPGYDSTKPVHLHLDNASLMSRRMYRTGLDDFDAIYEREGKRLPVAIARIIELARSRPADPYAAVRAYVASGSAEPAAQ
ncbi:MAG TPA: aminopeptidase [Gemmatimonadaceae bacterium]|nr:aminopeptidase [Gemmatimonadaceae bacterium]